MTSQHTSKESQADWTLTTVTVVALGNFASVGGKDGHDRVDGWWLLGTGSRKQLILAVSPPRLIRPAGRDCGSNSWHNQMRRCMTWAPFSCTACIQEKEMQEGGVDTGYDA